MPNFIHTRVDPQRLSTAASNIGENTRQLEAALNRVRQALSGTGGGSLQVTWTGPASTQFYSQYNADLETIGTYMQVLQKLNEQLQEAAAIFDNADKRAQQLVNQLKIG